jgi:hypothetical protein
VTANLAWRESVSTDRELLKGLRCTVEAPRDSHNRPLPHPRPWEREVEAWIRRQTPPAGPGEALRLGFHDDVLIAVGAAAFAERQDDVAIVKIRAIGISTAVRGKDGAVADATIVEMMSSAIELAEGAGATRTVAAGWLDVRNTASRRLLARHGYRFNRIPIAGLEEWVVEVVVP